MEEAALASSYPQIGGHLTCDDSSPATAPFPVSETSVLLSWGVWQETKSPSGQQSLPPALCPQGVPVPRALLGSSSVTGMR